MDEKITYEDVLEYENLFSLAPSFMLERWAKKNRNLVAKFKSPIKSHLANLTSDQKKKLKIILDSDIDELQRIMDEAYVKTGKKQYRVLANPNYKQFIYDNLNELRKLMDKG